MNITYIYTYPESRKPYYLINHSASLKRKLSIKNTSFTNTYPATKTAQFCPMSVLYGKITLTYYYNKHVKQEIVLEEWLLFLKAFYE